MKTGSAATIETVFDMQQNQILLKETGRGANEVTVCVSIFR